MRPSKLLFALLLALTPCLLRGQTAASVFDLLELSRPGLEQVAELHRAGNNPAAAQALLEYFRNRPGVAFPDVDLNNIAISADEQRWADEGLEHRFFVHTGYQPSYYYGNNIDWQYWPVRDNELRWQLHRMKWWLPMGKAYRLSGEERYAAGWCAQYLDWMRKNPLTEYRDEEATNWTKAANVYFAWRPLEVSDRLEFQIHQFLYFLPAQPFDAPFLSSFLDNYHRHAEHITAHFSASGNHLLFQAQRLIFAGLFFPEFREAARWRRIGVEILNREIRKQVYDDGMQYELDPHYHLESINIFFKALQVMDANGYRSDFPTEYLATIERMIAVQMNYTFPDYTVPTFSDAKLHTKATTLASYGEWAKVFPTNAAIRRMATQGGEGSAPEYLSQAFRTSGFYILRNGWEQDATVMVVKAGPPAFWHNQPDNGTFELWHKGRNFFPDSGSFVYAGDKEVTDQRNWFRQTRVHNTLTLDNRNLDSTATSCLRWTTGGKNDLLEIENPSYKGLTHRRTIWFVDRTFYLIADQASGEATGQVAIHYHLTECNPADESSTHSLSTRFDDGNNLLVKVFGAEQMERSEGWVSRNYRERAQRPSYAFTTQKQSEKPVRMLTILLPVTDAATPRIEASWHGDRIRVTINNKKYMFKYN